MEAVRLWVLPARVWVRLWFCGFSVREWVLEAGGNARAGKYLIPGTRRGKLEFGILNYAETFKSYWQKGSVPSAAAHGRMPSLG